MGTLQTVYLPLDLMAIINEPLQLGIRNSVLRNLLRDVTNWT
jgi:hypothetical protein